MQKHSNSKNHHELDLLLAAEARAAQDRMRETGYAGIVFTMITPKGTVVIPGSVEEAELETLATFLRLRSIADAARVGVITRDVWMAILKPRERMAPGVQAGEHPHRRRGLMQSGEALGGIYTYRFIPVRMGAGGRIDGFEPAEVLPYALAPELFNRLMPACAPSAQERQAAAWALAVMAIHIFARAQNDSSSN